MKALGLAVLSGVLLTLAFPKWDLDLLAWGALVPLFLAARAGSPKAAFLVGWVGGAVFYAGTLYWVVHAIGNYSNITGLLALGPLVLMCAILALYTGGFLWAWRFCERHGVRGLWVAPFIWVAFEWLRSFFFIGFPWVSLGYSQYRRLDLIQFAEVTGVYGVSALLVFVNAALFEAVAAAAAGRRRIGALLAALSLVAALASAGAWRRAGLKALPTAHRLRVAVIQGNVEQDRKWEPAYQEETVARYEGLTRRAASAGVDLVVWPETALPFYFQEEPRQARRLLALGRETGTFLLFGSPAFRESRDAIALFNRAYLTSPAGEVVGHYDKIRLAPFGEYVPFQSVLFFVDKLVEGIGDFEAGSRHTVFTTPRGRFGVLICYEDVFPDLTRRFVGEGADFLVNITNDAWFGRTSAPYQHLAMAAFRAVENRVPLVRSANTGVSAFIDIDGRIRSRTRLFETRYRVADLDWPAVEAFYTRRGDLFAHLSALVCAVVLGYGSFRERRRRKKHAERA